MTFKTKIVCRAVIGDRKCNWFISDPRPSSKTFKGDTHCPDCGQSYAETVSFEEEYTND